uniref:Vesicle transport protein n=1 Tax=Picocystis salinarum TaxID=88271 RepID=A0A7S3XBS3_9CHLO
MGKGGKQGITHQMMVAVGMQEEREPTLWDEIDEAVSLSRTQRIYGFAICAVTGMILGFLSLLFLFPVPDFVGFGILYSFGSVLTVMSTMFLVGPVKQIKNMLKKNRIIATVVYLTSIALTLYCAIALEDGLLVRNVLNAIRKFSAMHLLTTLNAFRLVCIGPGLSPCPVCCVPVVLLNLHPVWAEDACQSTFVLVAFTA